MDVLKGVRLVTTSGGRPNIYLANR